MTDDHTQPPAEEHADHPSSAELSEYVDGLLSPGEAASADAHLHECPECDHEVGLLVSVRELLRAAGEPVPAAGAKDSAVATAMASLIPSSGEAREAGVVPISAAPTPEESRRRSVLRHRRLQVAARAAVAVLVAGGLGGTGYAVAHSYGRSPSESATATTASGARKYAGSPGSPSTTQAHLAPVQPPGGVFALQLRPEGAPESCSKVEHRVIDVNGSPVAVNPPPAVSATVAMPVVSGQPRSCVAVGPAFATAWRDDVTGVTLTAVRAGTPSSTGSAGAVVEVTIGLGRLAVSDPARLDSAVAGLFTVAVVAEGAELTTAEIKAGPVLVLSVSRSVATFLAQQLGTPHS